MSDSLGSLVVSLVAETAQFNAGMLRAVESAEKTASGVTGQLDRIGKSLDVVVGGVGLFGSALKGLAVGAFVAGVGEMIKSTIEMEAGLFRTAQATGATVEALSAMRTSAKLSSTDMDLVASGMQKLANNSSLAAAGTGKAGGALKALGFDAATFATQFKSTDAQLLAVAQRLDKFADGPTKTALAMQLLGKAGANLLPFLHELAERGTDAVKVTTEQAKAAEELEKSITKLKTSFNGIVIVLANTIVPVLQKVIEGIDRFKTIAIAAIAAFVVWPATLTAVTVAVTAYRDAIIGASLAMELFGQRTSIITMLGGIQIAAAFGTTALTALRAAGGLLFAAFAGWQIGKFLADQFVEVRVYGIRFVEAMLVGWENIKYGAQVAWEVIKLGFFGMVNQLRDILGGFIEFVGKGLAYIPGLSDVSAQVEAFGETIKSSGSLLGEYDAKIASLGAENTKAKESIRAITQDMIAYEYSTEKVVAATARVKPIAPTPVAQIKQGSDALLQYAKALADVAKAYDGAIYKGAEAALKTALESLKRDYDRGVVDFQGYWTRLVEIQNRELDLQTNKLQQDLTRQKALVQAIRDEILKMKPGDNAKTQAAYIDTVTKAEARLLEEYAKEVAISGDLNVKQEERTRIGKDYLEQLIAANRGVLDGVLATQQAVEASERENEQIGLTKTQIAQLSVVRKIAIRDAQVQAGASQDVIDALNREIDATQRLADSVGKGEYTQKLIDGFKDAEQAGKSLYDTLTDGQTSWGDKAKTIIGNVKKWFLDLLYELTVKKWIISIGASLTGVSGNALANATNPGGLLGLAGQGGSGVGGLSSLGGLFGAAGSTGLLNSSIGGGASLAALFGGATTFGASTFATGGALAGAGIGFGAGAGAIGAGSALVAAIPVVGWALAAAAAIYAIVQSNKKPSPVEGQFAFQQASTGFEDNAFTSSRFGNIGFADQGTQQFSGQAGQVLNQQISGLLDLFASRETDAQIAQTGTALQGTQFPHFSGTFTTEDFLAKYGDQILKQVATTAFDVLDPALGKVIAGFTGTGEALTKFIGGLLVFHDIAATLPDEIAAGLTASLDGTQEALDRVTTIGLAFSQVTDVLNADPMQAAIDGLKAQQQTAASVFDASGDALRDLIKQYDGSAAAATNLANATVAYYNAQVQLLAQLEQVKGAISDAFASTIRDITLQTLDNAGKGGFLNDEISRLQEQLFTSTDPQQIQALANQINQDINQLFGLLTPEEQQQQLGSFTDNIRELNDEITAHIADVQHDTTNAAAVLLTSVRDSMADLIVQQKATADQETATAQTQAEAAAVQLQAAQTPQLIVIQDQRAPAVNG